MMALFVVKNRDREDKLRVVFLLFGGILKTKRCVLLDKEGNYGRKASEKCMPGRSVGTG